jgi:hypothetical protein
MTREFFFYLDAWKFCNDNSIPIENIKRKDWKVWEVSYEMVETE